MVQLLFTGGGEGEGGGELRGFLRTILHVVMCAYSNIEYQTKIINVYQQFVSGARKIIWLFWWL